MQRADLPCRRLLRARLLVQLLRCSLLLIQNAQAHSDTAFDNLGRQLDTRHTTAREVSVTSGTGTWQRHYRIYQWQCAYMYSSRGTFLIENEIVEIAEVIPQGSGVCV